MEMSKFKKTQNAKVISDHCLEDFRSTNLSLMFWLSSFLNIYKMKNIALHMCVKVKTLNFALAFVSCGYSQELLN